MPTAHDCTLAGPVTLAPGEFRDLILLVQGPPVAPGFTHVQNCVYFDWKGQPGDPNPHNEFACAEISTLPPDHPDARPMVSIEKGCRIRPAAGRRSGTPMELRLPAVKVTNIGTKPLEGPIEFTDELTAASGNIDRCSVGLADGPAHLPAPAAGPFTCTHPPVPGGLAPGDNLSRCDRRFKFPRQRRSRVGKTTARRSNGTMTATARRKNIKSCALALVCDAGFRELPTGFGAPEGRPPQHPARKAAIATFEVFVQNTSATPTSPDRSS